MTPPNTLINYFRRREDDGERSKVTSPSLNQSQKEVTNSSDDSSSDCMIVAEDEKDSKKKRKKRSSDRLKKKRKSEEMIADKADSGKENDSSPSTSRQEEADKAGNEFSKGEPLSSRQREQTGAAAASSVTMVTKRTKQTSIASMFAKQQTVKETKMQCPICQKDMPSKTSNKEFNEHIDKCLSNSVP